jgi:hypothetical protein
MMKPSQSRFFLFATLAVAVAMPVFSQVPANTLKFTTPALIEETRKLRAEPGSMADRQALLASAEKGNAAAMFLVSGAFITGSRGFVRDEQAARQWADRAAEKGVYEAWAALGQAYEQGQGVPRRDQIAETLYRQASDNGYIPAKTLLAGLVMRVRPKEASQGIALLREADVAGDLIATNQLGYVYLFGLGTSIDVIQAERHFTRALELGDSATLRGLGLVYLSTTGSLFDRDKAERWLTQATTRGDIEAPFWMAAAYNDGLGFGRDAAKNEQWLRLGERHMQQVRKQLLFGALGQRTQPYVMADGTRVHRTQASVAFEDKEGGVIEHGVGTPFTSINIDGARNPSSIRLDFYPCGKRREDIDYLRADALVKGGEFVNAIIEIRKRCGEEKPLTWLKQQAENGYAQLQMEYADWLRAVGSREAIYWYMLGQMRMREDVILCQDQSARGAPSILAYRYRPLAELMLKMPRDEFIAISEKAAAESARLGVAGSPSYACHHGISMQRIPFDPKAGPVRTPALVADTSWSQDRQKLREAMLEGARKRSN